jgi:hypothetical protein
MQVVLDGCSCLTEISAQYLVDKCQALKCLNMVATSVAYPPAVGEREIEIKLEGCPLIPEEG